MARVTVRVGDYKTDSSGGRGDGALELAALDDDPIALRSALWTATDQAYKSALAAYAQKQAALKQVQTPPQADDFSHEKPLISLAEPAQLKRGRGRVGGARGARQRTLPDTTRASRPSERNVQYSTAQFSRPRDDHLAGEQRGNHCAQVRHGISGGVWRGHAGGGRDAAGPLVCVDGQRRSSDLDSPEAFDQHAVELIASLTDLRKAPLVEEEYHGPLLLSADAGADTLRVCWRRGVTATRPRLGTEARTNGPFASSYHARVLPEFMDVVDDPGLKSYDGKGLRGRLRCGRRGRAGAGGEAGDGGAAGELSPRPRAGAGFSAIERPWARRDHRCGQAGDRRAESDGGERARRTRS